MIIPSIDIMNGRAVQLRQGRDLVLDGGAPLELVERFGRVGEVAVIDLDAAFGTGSNEELIAELCRRARCRVGGGIRTAEAALSWLERGAAKVILGTAARPEILRRLPRDRVIAALDARDGDVVVDGWRTRTGTRLDDAMVELRDLVDEFLVTFVEREGELGGTDLDRAASVVDLARAARVTIAGGITTTEEIAALDARGADAQTGMALYTGRLDLTDAFAAPLKSDRDDGLFATLVCDPTGVALGLAWSDRDSLAEVIDTGRGVYRSRKRGCWEKGATSGATQRVLGIDVDCDRDVLRFRVEQAAPGFCHSGSWSCFGGAQGLAALEGRLRDRLASADERSFTRALAADRSRLAAKLVEEAGELGSAASSDEVVWEAADLAYLATVALARESRTWSDVAAELDRRAGSPPHRAIPKEDGEKTSWSDVLPIVRPIIRDVRRAGDAGVRRHARRLGELSDEQALVIERTALERARDALPAKDRRLLERTARRIRSFAEAQRSSALDLETPIEGGRAGHRWTPLKSAGCYVPGGRYPLPSSALMTAVTARVAGVERVWIASPSPDPVVLAAAAVAGADAVIPIGGAQAVAALAYGTESIPACDVIVGPGNAYVTAAKSIVRSDVRIDMLAGPSELVIVADASACAETVAADLIAQAEHDPSARPILLALDERLAADVRTAIANQLTTLPTADIARSALASDWCIPVADIDEARERVSDLAPEHLALHLQDARTVAATFSNYGAIFIGSATAEVLGDYGAGPNHVLPTNGTARRRGGLSILDFMVCRTWMSLEDDGDPTQLVEDAASLARLEGLEGHARSAARRAAL